MSQWPRTSAANGAQPTLETLVIPAASTTAVATTFQLQAGQQSPSVNSFNRLTPITTLPGEFGVIPVNDAQGTIINSNGTFTPGTSGWLAAALAARTQVFASGAAVGASQATNLNGSQHYLFYSITSGTAASLLASNPTNSASGSAVALFSIDAANPDALEHFRWFGPEQVDQSTSGLGTANDTRTLHIMDTLGGGEDAFDRFKVQISY